MGEAVWGWSEWSGQDEVGRGGVVWCGVEWSGLVCWGLLLCSQSTEGSSRSQANHEEIKEGVDAFRGHIASPLGCDDEVVWCSVARCGLVLCGVVWCGVAWSGLVWSGLG